MEGWAKRSLNVPGRQGGFQTKVLPRGRQYKAAIAPNLSLLILAGISSRCPAFHDREHLKMSILKLNHKDNDSTIEARRGDLITVSLHENPTTGYRWVVDNIDRKILEFQKAEFHLAPKASVGGGGIRIFKFQAISAGSFNLALKLRREWQGDASIIERYHISIKVL